MYGFAWFLQWNLPLESFPNIGGFEFDLFLILITNSVCGTYSFSGWIPSSIRYFWWSILESRSLLYSWLDNSWFWRKNPRDPCSAYILLWIPWPLFSTMLRWSYSYCSGAVLGNDLKIGTSISIESSSVWSPIDVLFILLFFS